MSSRVLSGINTSLAVPVRWRSAPGTPDNPLHAQESQGPECRDPEPSPVDAVNVQLTGLQQRIRELEAELLLCQERARHEKAEAERAGAESATAAVRPLIERLTSTLSDLASYRARFRRESEAELLKLSVAVAKKILRRELTVDPHSLLGIVKGALETMNRAEVLVIRSSMSDSPFLSEALATLALPGEVEVIGDRTLEPGALILETKRGQVDISIQTQLTEIENGFADRIAGQKSK